MTTRELIAELLNYDMDSEVYIEDNVAFTDKLGSMDGTAYRIEKVEDYGEHIALMFDNYHHVNYKGGVNK